METIELCLSFIDIVKRNDCKQIGFKNIIEQTRDCLINVYREKNFVSTISLLRTLS